MIMSHPRFVPTLLLLLATANLSCGPTKKPLARGRDSGKGTVTHVNSTRVTKKDLKRTVTVPGSVFAFESAKLYSRVGGYLNELDADIGDQVVKGQVLARIQVPELRTELLQHEADVKFSRSQVDQQSALVQQANAALVVAKANLDRVAVTRRERLAEIDLRKVELASWQELIKGSPAIERSKLDEARFRLRESEAALAGIDADKVIQSARIEDARAAIRKAQADERAAKSHIAVVAASLETSRARLEFSSIKAPYDGVIVARYCDTGAFIRPAGSNSEAQPVLRIARVDKVRVRLDVPMDSVASLTTGDPIVFDKIPAAPGLAIKSSITRISEALEERSRMMRAEVVVDNPVDPSGKRRLRPGYYGRVTVVLEAHPATLSVPASAVFERGGQASVFRIDGGVARLTPIEVVIRTDAHVGVGSGLELGQEVVVSGASTLEDGQKIMGNREAQEAGR